MRDPRWTALARSLRQLQYHELDRLIRHVEQGRPLLLDRDPWGRANYSMGCYCPLAVATDLAGWAEKQPEEKRDQWLVDAMTRRGLQINNTRGVEGEFYTTDRLRDLMEVARRVRADLDERRPDDQAWVEQRAAELVALSAEGKYGQMTRAEYDWLVHGDWPAHTPYPRDPESDEEWAGLLAHEIEHGDE